MARIERAHNQEQAHSALTEGRFGIVAVPRLEQFINATYAETFRRRGWSAYLHRIRAEPDILEHLESVIASAPFPVGVDATLGLDQRRTLIRIRALLIQRPIDMVDKINECMAHITNDRIRQEVSCAISRWAGNHFPHTPTQPLPDHATVLALFQYLVPDDQALNRGLSRSSAWSTYAQALLAHSNPDPAKINECMTHITNNFYRKCVTDCIPRWVLDRFVFTPTKPFPDHATVLALFQYLVPDDQALNRRFSRSSAWSAYANALLTEPTPDLAKFTGCMAHITNDRTRQEVSHTISRWAFVFNRTKPLPDHATVLALFQYLVPDDQALNPGFSKSSAWCLYVNALLAEPTPDLAKINECVPHIKDEAMQRRIQKRITGYTAKG
jgi:hypothetical protein